MTYKYGCFNTLERSWISWHVGGCEEEDVIAGALRVPFSGTLRCGTGGFWPLLILQRMPRGKVRSVRSAYGSQADQERSGPAENGQDRRGLGAPWSRTQRKRGVGFALPRPQNDAMLGSIVLGLVTLDLNTGEKRSLPVQVKSREHYSFRGGCSGIKVLFNFYFI